MLYRRYDLNKLEKDSIRSQLKDVPDFYDTNLEDTKKVIKNLRSDQNRLMKIKQT